jgi:hypothetical protein
LLPNGELSLGSNIVWLIFDSLDEARKYAESKVINSPEIECNIYNHSNEFVERKWNEEYWNIKKKS